MILKENVKNKKKQTNIKPKKPFYKRWWFIIIVVLMFIGSIGSNNENPDEQTSKENATENQVEEVSINLPDYTIVEQNDFSIAGATRYSYEVVVNEKVTTEDLKKLSEFIVENAKNEHNFNALHIVYNDYKEFIGLGSSLGIVEFAPEGDWGKANTVAPGEYDNMQFSYSLKEKDWNKRLTKEEVAVFKKWNEERHLDNESEDNVIDSKVSKELNLDVEKIKRIVMKQLTWMY